MPVCLPIWHQLAPTPSWFKENTFKDDPSYFQLSQGTLAFAKSGPDSNSTQVFINYRDNSRLVQQGFTAFARVVEGYDIAERFEAVGDESMGLGPTVGQGRRLPQKAA